eukprot:m.188901 g.188901  ORF g.188901 m.188901 type:complete len:126 (+) comp18528_c0_seq46:988-1365(+)
MLPRTEAQELKSDKLLHCICLDNTNNEISQQHLRICKFGSKIINMHSVVVNELTTMCRQSGLTVQIEPRDLPNRNEGGDLKVTGITSLGKPLIIDVTIPIAREQQIAHVTAEIRLRSGNYPAIIN